MNIETAITPDAANSEQALEKLRRSTKSSPDSLTEAKRKEINKVAKDFESLFLNMMLKSMRETVAEDKITGGGKAEETYRFMLDQEYSNLAAKRGGVGIGSMVEKELLKRYGAVSLTQQAAKTQKLED